MSVHSFEAFEWTMFKSQEWRHNQLKLNNWDQHCALNPSYGQTFIAVKLTLYKSDSSKKYDCHEKEFLLCWCKQVLTCCISMYGGKFCLISMNGASSDFFQYMGCITRQGKVQLQITPWFPYTLKDHRIPPKSHKR